MNRDALIAWVAAGLVPDIRGRIWKKFTRRGGRFRELISGEYPGGALEQLLNEPGREALFQDAERIVSLSESGKFGILTPAHAAYPRLLKSIFDPPLCLYYRGDVRLLQSACLGVVGTRNPTPYGVKATRMLCVGLAHNDITVVSGLALGIDAVAHETVLKEGGKTLAVLGCGLDSNYPAGNRAIRKALERYGLVITEYPWGTRPFPANFPRRNRIISGISRGTLIIEAREGSGALITINQALEQGREIFAVPGAITSPASRGPLRLIQQGATPVTSVRDILEFFRREAELWDVPQTKAPPPEPPEHIAPQHHVLWKLLGDTPVPADDLIQKSGLPPGTVHAVLLQWELSGMIKQLPGKQFILTPESY